MMVVTPHFMRGGFISCSLPNRKHKDEKCVVALQELIKVPMDIIEVMVINKVLVASMEARNQNKAISMIFHHSITYK
jgi:hypothetical protein